MRILVTASLLFFSLTANAATTTIDFEEFEVGGSYLTLDSQGFRFDYTPVNSVNTMAIVNGQSGSDALLAPEGTVTVTNIAGESFSLFSFDAYGLSNEIVVTGYLEVGGTLQTTLPASGGVDVYNFGGWTGLTSLELSPDVASAMDNFAVAAVPVPAAVWLFGSALGLLGWRNLLTK